MADAPALPEFWQTHTGPIRSVTQPPPGCNFTVYLLTAARGRFIVKHGDTPEKVAELERECRVLEALSDHVPWVVRPVAQSVGGGLFLFTYLDGETMVDALDGAGVPQRRALVEQFARALRRVHAWQPLLPRPADWLSEAVTRAAAGVADRPIEHAHGLWDGADPRRVVRALQTWRPSVANDLVFCHGDCCLPNVLVRGESVTGLIDWSAGGYADRRFDLATALYTLRRNLGGSDYGEIFLSAYGYHEPAESLRHFEALYVLF